MYSCQWASCDAQAPTLDKLMTHICNSHIGSGKVIYIYIYTYLIEEEMTHILCRLLITVNGKIVLETRSHL